MGEGRNNPWHNHGGCGVFPRPWEYAGRLFPRQSKRLVVVFRQISFLTLLWIHPSQPRGTSCTNELRRWRRERLERERLFWGGGRTQGLWGWTMSRQGGVAGSEGRAGSFWLRRVGRSSFTKRASWCQNSKLALPAAEVLFWAGELSLMESDCWKKKSPEERVERACSMSEDSSSLVGTAGWTGVENVWQLYEASRRYSVVELIPAHLRWPHRSQTMHKEAQWRWPHRSQTMHKEWMT